jgi:hypothetical protein
LWRLEIGWGIGRERTSESKLWLESIGLLSSVRVGSTLWIITSTHPVFEEEALGHSPFRELDKDFQVSFRLRGER